MNFVFDFLFLVLFLLFAIFGAAAGANFDSIFRDRKEDNLIFNAISYVPRAALSLIGIRQTSFNTSICSALLALCIFLFFWLVVHPLSVV